MGRCPMDEKSKNRIDIRIEMNLTNILRFGIVGALWLGLCYYITTHAVMTFTTWFSMLASGIIIFVPMWKKYIRDNKDKNQ